MVYDGRWKLLFGKGLNARSVDALYDLQQDPTEMHNLLRASPVAQETTAQAERLKLLLVAWLERIHGADLDGVKRRSL
jgi:hypothetical protein